MRSVSPADAVRALQAGAPFFDVRSPSHHARDGLPGSRNLPLEAIQSGTVPTDVEPDEPVYLVCERGLISELAGLYLEQAGFTAVVNVRGGLVALRPLL
ncbi:MAG: rhodanese-like domain-containing protein [Deinococcales bacterium]|jgi:rhodanese-related sulfurtransferase